MKREESKGSLLDLATTQVTIGNKAYNATDVDWIQTPGQFPEIRVCATVSPFNMCSPMIFVENLSIKKVIFNPPATIVFWSDNTKTVVKCDPQQDVYDPEKGIAMAVTKKMLGNNKYEYYNIFKHWLKKWDKQKQLKYRTVTDSNWTGDMSDAY